MCYNRFMDARIKAYAKLNLTLDILGAANGFHLLDSLVCTVDLYDLIKISRRADGKITVEMHGMGSELIEPEKNNACLAAKNIKPALIAAARILKFTKISLWAQAWAALRRTRRGFCAEWQSFSARAARRN